MPVQGPTGTAHGVSACLDSLAPKIEHRRDAFARIGSHKSRAVEIGTGRRAPPCVGAH